MASQQYLDLLKDPRWQRKRLEVFDGAQWKCQRCGAGDKELHVHHFHYRNEVMPWEYGLHELASVCGDCHAELSAQRAALKRALFKYESRFLPIDKVIKYIEAQAAWVDGETVLVETEPQALGVADAVGCSAKEVVDSRDANGNVDPLELDTMTMASPRIPAPANEAA